MNRKRPIRRKSYLLLEVLISLGLVLLCLFPLVKPLVHIRLQTTLALEETRLERLASLAFIEVKQRLYEHQYSWDELRKGIEDELSPITLTIKDTKTGNEQSKTIHRHFVIEKIDRCYRNKTTQNTYMFLNLIVTLKNGTKMSSPFVTTLFAERKENETT